MAAAISRHEIDLTKGSILKKLIIFATPLILMNLLQRLFNTIDIIVLGVLVNDKAVGSVGATGSLINLLINFFIGLSVGASAVLSKSMGERNMEKSRRIVGTSIVISLIGGIILGAIGFFGAETFLIWMNCDAELLPQAVTYVQIYFLGLPIILFYNFVAGILRAVGDTVRPMIYLTIAGVANLILNVFFIVVFNMTVEGVAIGTIGSQLIASILAFIAIRKGNGYSKFEYKNFRIAKKELKEIMIIGIPSGLQNCLFSLSNVIINATVNSYGAAATTGASIASQFDALIYTVGNSIALAGMAAVSQNYGARNMKRVKETIVKTTIFCAICQFAVGLIFVLLSDPLCRIMSQDPLVLKYANSVMYIIGSLYFICGMMEVLAFSMRALGRSTTAMIVTLIFACLFRIVWLYTFYLLNPTFEMIYYSYPISWIMNIIVDIIILVRIVKNVQKDIEKEKIKNQEQAA